mgnify:CR=1 FL=1
MRIIHDKRCDIQRQRRPRVVVWWRGQSDFELELVVAEHGRLLKDLEVIGGGWCCVVTRLQTIDEVS